MTILHALSEIASQQAKPTKRTLLRVAQLLYYMATNPNTKIWFRALDMILNIPSDSSYLTATRVHRRAGGYFFLGILSQDKGPIKLIGNILITCAILKHVAASAAEAQLGALLLNS